MDLVVWIHWLKRRLHRLDIKNVLLMNKWMIVMKDNYLDFQNTQLMRLQMAT